jgi:hypothetical protein
MGLLLGTAMILQLFMGDRQDIFVVIKAWFVYGNDTAYKMIMEAVYPAPTVIENAQEKAEPKPEPIQPPKTISQPVSSQPPTRNLYVGDSDE